MRSFKCDKVQNHKRSIRAFESDIAFINERAKGLACSSADIIHVMCNNLRKELYLQELGEAYDSLRNNPEEWAAFQKEQELWDCTISDGLDDNY